MPLTLEHLRQLVLPIAIPAAPHTSFWETIPAYNDANASKAVDQAV